MNTLCFDHRLFQRGQTRRECLESWSPERNILLRKAAEGVILKETLDHLLRFPRGTRLLVYYSPWGLDSVKTLPFIFNTLARAEGIVARFFNEDVFHPIFGPGYGRSSPRLFILDKSGQVLCHWGPRPARLSQQLQLFNTGEEKDSWLKNVEDTHYLASLDTSIAHELLAAAKS